MYNFQEYLNALKALPKDDSPAIFGLPDNINRAWEQRNASKIIIELKSNTISIFYWHILYWRTFALTYTLPT